MIGRRVYMPSRGSTSVYCCSQEGEQKLTSVPNRGEQTAAALEANLSALESKLDEMLASLDAAGQDVNGAGDDEDHVTANGDSKLTEPGQS